MTVLCLSPHCYTTELGVLVPRQAADGLRLCNPCVSRLAPQSLAAADLYDELALALTTSGTPGETPPPNKPGSREPNEAAVWSRAHIRHTLASWCKLIAEDRGLSLPDDDVHAMASYIGRHSMWLAAQSFADEVCVELRELAFGRARAVAYPSGGRSYQIRAADGQPVPCPCRIEGEDEKCGGTLWAILRRSDSPLPSELACDVDDGHRLASTQWLRYGQQLHEEAA